MAASKETRQDYIARMRRIAEEDFKSQWPDDFGEACFNHYMESLGNNEEARCWALNLTERLLDEYISNSYPNGRILALIPILKPMEYPPLDLTYGNPVEKSCKDYLATHLALDVAAWKPLLIVQLYHPATLKKKNRHRLKAVEKNVVSTMQKLADRVPGKKFVCFSIVGTKVAVYEMKVADGMGSDVELIRLNGYRELVTSDRVPVAGDWERELMENRIKERLLPFINQQIYEDYITENLVELREDGVVRGVGKKQKTSDEKKAADSAVAESSSKAAVTGSPTREDGSVKPNRAKSSPTDSAYRSGNISPIEDGAERDVPSADNVRLEFDEILPQLHSEKFPLN